MATAECGRRNRSAVALMSSASSRHIQGDCMLCFLTILAKLAGLCAMTSNNEKACQLERA